MSLIIENGTIVNEGKRFKGSILIENGTISCIIPGDASPQVQATERIDASGRYILPGVIDDHVHFRTPGAEHKATIETESKAAVLGGVTSFMDMPNNTPPATTLEAVGEKFNIAARSSWANYSFYLGATNDNIDEIRASAASIVCGIKLFMGSSTGNMLVDSPYALERIFAESPLLVAAHCEDEQTIRHNLEVAKRRFGEKIPFSEHPNIRSREACIECSRRALELAERFGTHLHILHLSTADEVEMMAQSQRRGSAVTGEACVHYLWFSDEDYAQYGSKVKCNPAIKRASDRNALRAAVKSGLIGVVATDHAPHLKEEKRNDYLRAPGGLPLVRHSLQMMLQLVERGLFTIEQVVARMSHGPAECFGVEKRGYIREGYYADLVLVDPSVSDYESVKNPPYKCGWSPLEGTTFSNSVTDTFVNGLRVVKDGRLTGARASMALRFKRDKQ